MSHQPIVPVALKEWAVNIEALAQGKQILLMRKGGIHEETRDFQLMEEIFYLFPTYLHQKKELLKSEYQAMMDSTLEGHDPNATTVQVHYLAKVADDLLFEDEESLKKVEPFHIWTQDFAETKLHWKKEKPIHALLVRVYQLETPIEVMLRDEYNGCKSWITFEDPIPKSKLNPVLSDEQFAEQVRRIKEVL